MEEKMQCLRYIDDDHQSTSQHDEMSSHRGDCNKHISRPESFGNSARHGTGIPDCGSYYFGTGEENGSDEEYEEEELRLILIYYHTDII